MSHSLSVNRYTHVAILSMKWIYILFMKYRFPIKVNDFNVFVTFNVLTARTIRIQPVQNIYRYTI